jgi:hypothetical protein
VHGDLPETTFEKIEERRGPPDPAADKVLERYYAVKVSSLQFFGPTNFGFPFWEGFQSLAFTFPMVAWLMRASADLPPEEAAVRAVSMVDLNFGFNRLLGSSRFRWILAILAHRGELEKLIAWYSR